MVKTSASGFRYSPREIADAAGVPEREVRVALGLDRRRRSYVSHGDAVRVARALRRSARAADAKHLFSLYEEGLRPRPTTGLPFALSSTLHVGTFVVSVFLTTLGLAPARATAAIEQLDEMRLVFLAVSGPGGGGGGGGLRQKQPPPKAEREGNRTLSSPLPARQPPTPIAAPREPEPEPSAPEDAEIIEAPVAEVAADPTDQVGVLEPVAEESDSRGAGSGGGVDAGDGTGIGVGTGPGLGDGSGGGTGGGPYRPGSGIEPPRLLREIKPSYTEEARIRKLEGEVLLEIVVRRDGSVRDVKIVRGLGSGLNDQAVGAVRQWRFSPARRHGTPVDVIVEVAVEFRLR